MKIEKNIIGKIIQHAQKQKPVEACGYLGGQDGVISTIYEMTNIDNSPDHFSFNPKEQFAVLKETRTKGLTLLANYHSHPSSPVRPSQEDIRLAADPNIVYFIVSLAGKEPDVAAFHIRNQQVESITIEVVDYDKLHTSPAVE